MSKTPNKTDSNDSKTETTTNPWMWPGAQAYEQFVSQARAQFAGISDILDGYWKQVAEYETAVFERARKASHDMAKLTQDSLDYLSQLSGEWRKMAEQTTQRMGESLQPRS